MVVKPDQVYESAEQCQQSEDFIAYDRRDDRLERRISTLSCGLVEAVPQWRTANVQFVHQSVDDFFVQGGLLALDKHATTTQEAEAIAHHRLSSICLSYLAMEEQRRRKDIRGRRLQRSGLMYYAKTNWLAHAERGDSVAVSKGYEYGVLPDKIDLMKNASRYGLPGLMKALLRRAEGDNSSVVNSDLGDGRTPLSIAAQCNQQAVVELLLADEDIDVNLVSKYGQTALDYAVEAGHRDIVRLLLDTGEVDISSIDSRYSYLFREAWSAMSLAGVAGNHDVLKMLEEHIQSWGQRSFDHMWASPRDTIEPRR
jgi:hypothetical protein